MLLSESALLVLPPMLGAKVTENFVDWPALNVRGIPKPLTPNPFPGPVIWVMSRFAFPVLLTVTVCVLVAPTGTLPKLRVLGVIAIAGDAA